MSDNQACFDFEAQRREHIADSHRAHKTRVKGKIASNILDFLIEKGPGAQFHLQELSDRVVAETGCVGDSVSRILRDLRNDRECSYDKERGKSLYTIKWVVRRR